jgi:lysophospholipase L1-like esterase
MPQKRRSGWLGAALAAACCGITLAPRTPLAAEPATLTDAEIAGASHLSSTAGLRSFFTAVEVLERHQALHPLRILQIGDSHTAGDYLSGRLRERLQARFGASGRGWLPSGIPYKWYRPELVTVTESGWQHFGSSDAAQQPMGTDLTIARSTAVGARMTLTSTEEAGFNRFALELLTQPNAGSLVVRIDQRKPILISGEAPALRLKRVEMDTPNGARTVEISARDRLPVELLGWAIERRRPGIIYENHGTIGATVNLIGKMNPSAVAFEFADRHPSLLIVAFGTNEGFDDALDVQGYATSFTEAVAALRERAPEASILILGPPDGNQLAKSCAAADPQNPAPGALDCVAEPNPAGQCAWHPPRNLAAVRQIQRRVAGQKGWAFWDWAQAMGGTCSMNRMLQQDPPLAAPDHVHLTKAGYFAAADALFLDLIGEYERWKRDRLVRR